MLKENCIWRIKRRSCKPEKIRERWGDRVNPRVRNIIKVLDATLQLIKVREGNEHSLTVVVSGYTKSEIVTFIFGIVIMFASFMLL